MAGIKNPLQQRNWYLPASDNSLTIEERDFELRKQMSVAPVFCHFCGKELILESTSQRSLDAIEITKQERAFGTHFDCYRKHTIID